MLYIKLFLSSFITFLILDFIWLGFIAKDFYARQLALYLTDNLRLTLISLIVYSLLQIDILHGQLK